MPGFPPQREWLSYPFNSSARFLFRYSADASEVEQSERDARISEQCSLYTDRQSVGQSIVENEHKHKHIVPTDNILVARFSSAVLHLIRMCYAVTHSANTFQIMILDIPIYTFVLDLFASFRSLRFSDFNGKCLGNQINVFFLYIFGFFNKKNRSGASENRIFEKCNFRKIVIRKIDFSEKKISENLIFGKLIFRKNKISEYFFSEN